MDGSSFDLFSVFAFAAFGFITFFIFKQIIRPTGLPPGPRLWPIVGNLPQLAGKNVVEVFRDMRRQYGDVFCLKLGSVWVMVINGDENLKDALIKRGDAFQERPNNFIFTKVLEAKGIIGASGLLWKEHRNFTISTLKYFGFGTTSLQDKILNEIELLIENIHALNGKPFILKPIIQGMFFNVIISIVFNQRYDYRDPKMQCILDLIHEHTTSALFAGVLDFMPWLEKIPGDTFHAKRLRKIEITLNSFMQERIDEHKETYEEGNPKDFTDMYLSELYKTKNDKITTASEPQLVRMCRDLLLAGSDTTATCTRWAILHMINKPEIQEKMYKEIEDVIGLDRLPDLNDRKHMSYCDAVYYETMRVSNVAPLAVPRVTKAELQFNGFLIPADTVVAACLDSVHFDENIFPNPEEFIPERFINDNALTQFVIPFAIGKRSCPGKVLAEQELFLTLVSLVQRFKFLPQEGVEKLEITRKFGVMFYPAECKLRAVPRKSV